MSNENRGELFKKWASLDEKQKGLDIYKIAQMLNNLEYTHYAVTKNYQDLISTIESYEENTAFWKNKQSKERIDFFTELSRLLHNYLSSTFTLVERGVDFQKNNIISNKNFQSQKHALAANNGYCFCRSLRHITQHIEFLELVAYFSRVGLPIGVPAKQSIILRKDRLTEYEIKTKADRTGFLRYINNHDKIDLKLALNEYENTLEAFYEWLKKEVEDSHQKELKEYSAISDEITIILQILHKLGKY